MSTLDREGGTPSEAVERAANELYRLPLEEFTGARDERARHLRQEGLRDEAKAVKALRKPTLAAWALNQLAGRRAAEVERLLEAGKQLRKAQEALLAGGDRSAFQRASAAERELVNELTRDATAVAGEVGRTATGSLDERIRATLHAAALDEQTAAELAAGRLVREREAAGLFGAAVEKREKAAGATTRTERTPERREARTVASGKRARDGSGAQKAAERREEARLKARRKARRKAEADLAAARAEQQKAQREHASAAKATELAAKRAQDAQRRADEARERAGDARAALRDAQRREREAATAYDRAARAVAATAKKLE